MRLTILNQYYWPHPSATGQLMTELAESLAARGHQVRVVAARVGAAGGGPLPREETRRGVEIVRLPTPRLGKRTLWARAADYGSFYAGALAHLVTATPAPDVILALSTPPLIAVPAQLMARLRGASVVSLVQDLYPDIAVALGAIGESSPLTAVWRRVASLSLRSSRRVIVLSDVMKERLTQTYGLPASQVETIHNWALQELLAGDPAPMANAFRARHGLGDRFVVTYSGNIGAGHCFGAVLDAAERLLPRDDIRFVLIGEGVRRQAVADAVGSRSLSNVMMLPPTAREELPLSLGAANAHLVTMRDGTEGLLMPSKLYGILAAARPVLFVGPEASEVARIVAEGACGEVFSTRDGAGLARTIAAWADAPEEAAIRGQAARRVLDGAFGRERAVDRYEALLFGPSGAHAAVGGGR